MKFLNWYKLQNQKGFTLLEILVVTVILGLMTTVAATIIINILRNQNKVNLLIEIRSNVGLVTDSFERDVRASKSFIINGSSVNLVLPDNNQIVWNCYLPGSAPVNIGTPNGVFTRTVGTGSETAITNIDSKNGTSVTSCSFTDNGNNLITIKFALHQAVNAPNKIEFTQSDVSFETSVSPRQQ